MLEPVPLVSFVFQCKLLSRRVKLLLSCELSGVGGWPVLLIAAEGLSVLWGGFHAEWG